MNGSSVERVEIGRATLYRGDCRQVLVWLPESAEALITDPVWPNAPLTMRTGQRLAGAERPFELFAEAMAVLPPSCKRLVVHLGCNSDPRFLGAVPQRLPFIRACWLEYATPHCTGRVLNGSDIAYAFGEPVAFQPGRQVIPGRSPKSQPGQTCQQHPCSRSLAFLRWLVGWFSDEGECVLDPFMGSGTTGVATVSQGRSFVGVEIDPGYFAVACTRIEAAQAQQSFSFTSPGRRSWSG